MWRGLVLLILAWQSALGLRDLTLTNRPDPGALAALNLEPAARTLGVLNQIPAYSLLNGAVEEGAILLIHLAPGISDKAALDAAVLAQLLWPSLVLLRPDTLQLGEAAPPGARVYALVLPGLDRPEFGATWRRLKREQAGELWEFQR